MSKDDFSMRAAKGQAYNLAVSTAIADGRHHDNKYVIQQYIKHLQVADMLQKSDPKTVLQALDNNEFLKALEGLDKCSQNLDSAQTKNG